MTEEAGRSAPDPFQLLRLDRQICFPLYAASNLLTRAYRKPLAELGLTYPQYLVMLVLWEEAPQTVGSLGRALHLDSGTLTPLLRRMEASGFITRRRDPQDERRVIVDLTAQGADLRARALHVPLTLATQLGLQPSEIETLRASVQKMMTALSHQYDSEASPGRP